MQRDTVLIQTQEWLMRGLDYKTADPRGIALLICSGTTSHRAYLQALGRVGRYAANCSRFTLAGAKEARVGALG